MAGQLRSRPHHTNTDTPTGTATRRGPHDRSFTGPARTRAATTRAVGADRASRSARACSRSGLNSTSMSPSSTIARPAAADGQQARQPRASTRSSSYRCCCRDAFDAQDDVRPLVASFERASRGCASSPPARSAPRPSCCRSSTVGCVTPCAPGTSRELDGLVFAAAGSVRRPQQCPRRAPGPAVGDPPPAALRDRVRHRLGPLTAEAVRTLRAQGRRHIAVGSWFLAPGSALDPASRARARGRRRRRLRSDGRRARDRRGRADPLRRRGDGLVDLHELGGR